MAHVMAEMLARMMVVQSVGLMAKMLVAMSVTMLGRNWAVQKEFVMLAFVLAVMMVVL